MDIPKARPANIFNNYAALINCVINLNKSPLAHTSPDHRCRKIYWVRRNRRIKLQLCLIIIGKAAKGLRNFIVYVAVTGKSAN